ncbi:MAG: hypothetical protein Q4D96_03925 [Propionibacteriaceae bacterium]|nr:hypothetical protein [Propionibacteriaceae bacterium]
MPPVPTPPRLRATIIMDYQNIHLVGHDTFSSRTQPLHETLIDPLKFAQQLVLARNAAQKPGYEKAVLGKVLVFRGLPSNEHDPHDYARSLRQKAQWQRDKQVKVVFRPLRYRLERDAASHPILDINEKPIILEKREKGIDVLCALALVREARQPGNRVVILASHDSDLEPALDEAVALSRAKVETMRWDSPGRHTKQLRCERQRLWSTRLDERAFHASRDLTPYP